MAFLLLRIFFTVSFSHLLRLSQARTRKPMAAASVNYLVAAFLCAFWARFDGEGWSNQTGILGGIAGFTYVSSLVLMLPSMRRSGVAVTSAVAQLSLMLPIAVATVRFREYPNLWQAVGIGLTVVALPLLCASTAVATPGSRSSISGLTLAMFFSTGLSQVVMKEFSSTRPREELALFSSSLFASASFFTWLWMTTTGDTGRVSPEKEGGTSGAGEGKLLPVGPIGIVLGVVNVLQLICLLRALQDLPAVIVFPVSAALGITVNVLVSMLLWKERPRPAGWLGLILAIAAVALLNLKDPVGTPR
ncbi:MAG: hypothetical protein FJX77_13105 [Armatimonadetes bacterium]|nr:hypothetical protein [Armatimonadota bacterium]